MLGKNVLNRLLLTAENFDRVGIVIIGYYLRFYVVENLLLVDNSSFEETQLATNLLKKIEQFKKEHEYNEPDDNKTHKENRVIAALLRDQKKAYIYCTNFVMSLYNDNLSKIQMKEWKSNIDLASSLWCTIDLFEMILHLWGSEEIDVSAIAKKIKIIKFYLNKLLKKQLHGDVGSRDILNEEEIQIDIFKKSKVNESKDDKLHSRKTGDREIMKISSLDFDVSSNETDKDLKTATPKNFESKKEILSLSKTSTIIADARKNENFFEFNDNGKNKQHCSINKGDIDGENIHNEIRKVEQMNKQSGNGSASSNNSNLQYCKQKENDNTYDIKTSKIFDEELENVEANFGLITKPENLSIITASASKKDYKYDNITVKHIRDGTIVEENQGPHTLDFGIEKNTESTITPNYYDKSSSNKNIERLNSTEIKTMELEGEIQNQDQKEEGDHNNHSRSLFSMMDRVTVIEKAQQSSKFAISALNYEDVKTAKEKLTEALQLLNQL